VRAFCILAAGAGLCLPRPLAGQTPAGPAPVPPAIEVHAFVSTSFSYGFNQPPSRANQLRVFDYDDDMFRIDEVELVALRSVAAPGELGFRVDFTAGAVSRVVASRGLFRDSSGEGQDIDLHQAFVSYVAPIGRGLRLDAGKFVTGLGYEVIEGYDGWNDNATHSFLFGYAIPFTHTGVRAAYSLSPAVAAMVMVANGWDDVQDNNRGKTVHLQLGFTPSPRLAVYLNGIAGPEQNNDDVHFRDVVDVVATWKPTDHVGFGLNGDWGRETAAAAGGRMAVWRGAAVYLRLASERTLALSVRAEVFDDRDGTRTGTAQTLGEVTLTPELRLGSSVVVRSDLRVDHSDRPEFDSRRGPVQSQPTASLNVLYHF
jgi:hypothetical protein